MKQLFLAAALVLGTSSVALAAPIKPASTCSVSDVTAEGQNALECTVQNGNDQLGNDESGYTVNERELFGEDDWALLGKDPGEPGENEFNLDISGIGSSAGTWTIDTGLLADFEAFMIVIKAGSEFAAYLFDGFDADSGTWLTFNDKDLSHFTLYVRGEGDGGGAGGGGEEPNEVPEPAALGLFGLGLMGIAMRRRRRS